MTSVKSFLLGLTKFSQLLRVKWGNSMDAILLSCLKVNLMINMFTFLQTGLKSKCLQLVCTFLADLWQGSFGCGLQRRYDTSHMSL